MATAAERACDVGHIHRDIARPDAAVQLPVGADGITHRVVWRARQSLAVCQDKVTQIGRQFRGAIDEGAHQVIPRLDGADPHTRDSDIANELVPVFHDGASLLDNLLQILVGVVPALERVRTGCQPGMEPLRAIAILPLPQVTVLHQVHDAHVQFREIGAQRLFRDRGSDPVQRHHRPGPGHVKFHVHAWRHAI